MTIRNVVFWLHLLTGLTAGAVIATMAVTGALLAFEPQLLAWAERDLWQAALPAAGAARLSLVTVVARAQERQGGERATTLTLRPDPRSSVRIGFGRDRALYVNPYSGDVVGAGSRTHDVMHTIEDWHRWLGARDLGRPVTGVGNLAFLGLACSGLFLWWPRARSRSAIRAIAVLDVRLRGRARHFNWHNTIGFWCAPVLIVLTLTGAVMSYQWANDLLYRLTGNAPPPAPGAASAAVRGAGAGRAEGGRQRGGEAKPLDLDALSARAAQQVPEWIGLTLRLPQRAGGAVTALIQEPPTWHPNPRSVLTLDAATAEVMRWEPFRGANMGRTLRVLARVLHTGEVGGVIGQLIAGLASAGGALLVYTGAALAWRRFRTWSTRGRRGVSAPDRRDLDAPSTSPSHAAHASQRRDATAQSQPAP